MTLIKLLRVSLPAVLLLFCASITMAATAGTDISPAEALEKLQSGNLKYISGSRNAPDTSPARRSATAKSGQHPYAVVLTCSDSRVPAEHVFQAGVGDIFVVRVAGNIAGTDEIGTVEYGVEHLRTPLLVVMGHSSCGAVTAVLKGDHVGGSIPELVSKIAPAADKAKALYGDRVTPVLLKTAIDLNAWQAIEDIFNKSEIVRELVKEGKLRVIAAYYDIETGRVDFMGEHPRQESFLSAVHAYTGGAAENHAMLGKADTPEAHAGVVYSPRPEPTGYTGNDGKIAAVNTGASVKLAETAQAMAITNITYVTPVAVKKTGGEVKTAAVTPDPSLLFRFNGPKGLWCSPRVALHVTLYVRNAPAGAESAEVSIYARRLGYHRSLVSKDLVFRVPTVFLKDGNAQTQFYWMAKKANKRLLDADKYILQGEVRFYSKRGKDLGGVTHIPGPKWNWIVSVN